MIAKEAAVTHTGWESKMAGTVWLDDVHVLSVLRHDCRVTLFLPYSIMGAEWHCLMLEFRTIVNGQRKNTMARW